MQITGTIKHIGQIETGSNDFKKRTVVVTVQNGNYSDDVAVELYKDRVSIADGLGEGQTVTAHINLRSREYNGRWYTNAICWKIEAQTEPATAEASEESSNDIPW